MFFKKLIELGKGDPGRLEHITIMLKNEKTLYESDKQYLENNFGIVVIEKKKLGKENIEREITINLEEKTKEIMPKNWKPKNENGELEKISKKLKKEEENMQNKKSKEIDIQKTKLSELIIQRKNNEEKVTQERKSLEEKKFF